ncbi:hypothetical protein Nepgr_004940 [Nepenthes gracilis]|uniref:BHLH domain-containing protein n=1 Tax=Nepenthes gracilis TaxID=150966 RepID=A0AAD3S2A2_NEPGR|nr:hypothetical protein Nepgr_004940 [Nepenthes gracilis]
MEPAGTAVEGGDWSTFNGVHVYEEADFIAQLFPSSSLTNELDASCSFRVATTWDGHESHFDMGMVDNSIYSSDSTNSNFHWFSQESSFSGGGRTIYPTRGHENYYMSEHHQNLAANNNFMPIDFCMPEVNNYSLIQVFPGRIEGDDCLNPEMISDNMDESGANLAESEIADKHLELKREAEMSEMRLPMKDKNIDSSSNSKKRSCVSDVQNGKRNAKLKANQKLSLEGNNGGRNGQSSSSCSSEDDSNASQELNGGTTSNLSSKGITALRLNGRTRANRGSATDPQSLYARKRRERINKRLRILQNLVPNGTKVDISTMLEEAVQYVKFLQLQIKLLSSDDLWMYAPIAYNGMDIGLDLKIINSPRCSTI